jgi:hypothetical protein
MVGLVQSQSNPDSECVAERHGLLARILCHREHVKADAATLRQQHAQRLLDAFAKALVRKRGQRDQLVNDDDSQRVCHGRDVLACPAAQPQRSRPQLCDRLIKCVGHLRDVLAQEPIEHCSTRRQFHAALRVEHPQTHEASGNSAGQRSDERPRHRTLA